MNGISKLDGVLVAGCWPPDRSTSECKDAGRSVAFNWVPFRLKPHAKLLAHDDRRE